MPTSKLPRVPKDPTQPRPLANHNALQRLEHDWLGWLLLMFPRHITRPFGDHHKAFWDWVWNIKRNVRPQPWISIWPRGGGKALSLNTPLPTPTGWTTMGNIQPGDHLFDERGEPCAVVSVSEVEIRECSRVHFGSGTYLDASNDHLWTVLDRRSRRVLGRIFEGIPASWASWQHEDRPQTPCEACGAHAIRRGPNRERWCGTCHARWKRGGDLRVVNSRPAYVPARLSGRKRYAPTVLSTNALGELTSNNEHEWAIPVAFPFSLPDAELPLDPWLFGYWLGDGTSSQGAITVGAEDVDEVQSRIESLGWTVKRSSKRNGAYVLHIAGLAPILKQMGVLGNKHVPSVYLRSSFKQRLSFLSALCDTDGSVKRNAIEFTNTNRNLIEAAYELIVSLGYRGSVSEGRATLYGKDCGPKWRIVFAAQPSEVFSLFRKRMAHVPRPMLLNRQLHFIKEIEPLPDQPVRCITVDSPNSLFLAGRAAIPTHNSQSAELAVAAIGARELRRYCVYVSESQDRADSHVQSIADLLESEEMAMFYPGMADRAVGKFGQWKGWRRNRLHTKSGFIVDALGLDAASRGMKVDVHRPDMLVFDDIDDHHDAQETVEQKKEALTRRILPATTNDAVILGIQNLIHVDSIFAQIADSRAPFLSDRILSGPIKALDNFTYETRIVDDVPRTFIVTGTPTWPGLDLDACQNEINKEGITVFLSELQHEVESASGGMFDHVVFRHCTADNVPTLDKIVCWVDPAVTDRKESDSCGIQIDGMARDGTLYRLWSWEERSGPLEAIRTAIRQAHQHGAAYVGIETDQGGDTWRDTFTRARDSLGGEYAHLTMRARKASQGFGGKVHRASQMLADYEKGMIVHVEGTHHILERALIRFPRTPPLDLVDAAQWAWVDLRRYGRPSQLASAVNLRVDAPSRSTTIAVPPGITPASRRSNLRLVPMRKN